MGTGRRRLAQVAHAVLAGLIVVCITTLGSLSATRASGQTASAVTGADAQPPAHPKRFYHAPNGQFYVPADTPIRLSIGLSPAGAQSSPEIADESSVTLKEGPQNLKFGEISVAAIADGTPPQTTLDIGATPHIEAGGLRGELRILGPNPKFHLTANDALSGVARTLVSIDGAPFEQLPADGPTITAEGDHRLRYLSIDQVGNAEAVKEFDFRLDSTPPETRLDVSGPHTDTMTGAGVELALSAQDANAGVEESRYRFDDGVEQAYVKSVALDALAEGPHHFQYYATDRVGNKEALHTFAFVIDRQPPEISNSVRGPQYTDKGVRYVSPQTEIELAAKDAATGPAPVSYRVDDAPAEVVYAAPFHLSERSGIHRLHLASEDLVHNRAEAIVSDLYVDLTPPHTEVEYSRPFFVRDGRVVLNPNSRIALNATDFESGVESVTYSVDGGPQQKYGQPFSLPKEGKHRVTLTAVDHVGNREPAQDLLIDIQPPPAGAAMVPVLDEKRWYQHPKLGLIGPPGLPFALRIAASPDDNAESYLISSGPQPASGAQGATPGPLTLTIPGPNTIKVAISPKAVGFAVAVDAAPPKTELTASGARRVEVGGVTYFGPGLKISLTAVDNPAGVSSGVWKTLYSLDGSPFTTYNGPLDAFLREGAYTLQYSSLDNVGNAEKPHTLEFTVDISAPKTRLELRGSYLGNIVAPATRIALIASDNLSGVAQVNYRIDDRKPVPYTEPFAIGPISEGPHRLRYFAVDAIGNSEEEHSWAFTVKRSVAPASFEVRGSSVGGSSVQRNGAVFVVPGSRIVLKAADGDKVAYALDGAAFATYASPLPAPEAGSHRLSFHAVDDLGNVSTTQTINLVADRTPPSSHVRFDGPQLPRDEAIVIAGATRIVLEANAGAIGGAALEYSLNGRTWQTYSAPFNIKTSGAYQLSYRARDPLANAESAQKQHIVVDTEGPAINITYSQPVDSRGATIQLQPGTLMLIGAEDIQAGLEKITYKIDDQPELFYRAPLSGFSQGKIHTIAIAAEDLLGNRTEKVVHLEVKASAR